MGVDTKTLDRICELSRIEIKEENKQDVISKLDNVIHWMDSLNEVDTSKVEPLVNVSSLFGSAPWREDKATGGNKVEQVLKNAPSQMEEHFLVPKVVE